MRKSINKTTVIIVLAVFLTLSVGYALFSDTITIEGTATAQGEFKVDKTCIPGIASELSVDISEIYGGISEESGYNNDYCNVTSEGVNLGVNLLRPGALRMFTVKIKNNNDFPVEIDMENGFAKYYKSLDGVEYDCDDYPEGENMCKAIDVWAEIDYIYFVVNGETQRAETYTIAPGDTMYITFRLLWAPDDDGELTNGKEVSSRFNYTFDIKQQAN